MAGCTANGTDDETSGESASPSSSPSPSDSPTPTDCQPDLTETSLEVLSVDCGTGENTADASVEPVGAATPDDDGTPPTYTVTVTGTIDAPDPCHSARLGTVRAAVDEDTLRLGVETYVPPEKQDAVCAECIADVDYEATAEFRCDYLGVVAVVHDGEQVAEVPLPE